MLHGHMEIGEVFAKSIISISILIISEILFNFNIDLMLTKFHPSYIKDTKSRRGELIVVHAASWSSNNNDFYNT